jgi:predicted NUDIX family NTP pyrophosphohydrolase
MEQSAGILLYKRVQGELFIFLIHPGGPLWKNNDLGSWSIPKGLFTDQERIFDAAIREFEEETGTRLKGDFIELEPVKLKSGKIVHAWAHEQDIDAHSVISNYFELEWPSKSGVFKSFPEVDKAEWFTVEQAFQMINSEQRNFISQLISKIGN